MTMVLQDGVRILEGFTNIIKLAKHEILLVLPTSMLYFVKNG